MGIDLGHETVQLLLRGKRPHKQQIGHLLESEAAVGPLVAQQVVYVVAAVGQMALVGHLNIIGHYVAMHVGDIRNASNNARAVGVAQAALHVEALVAAGVHGVDGHEVLVKGKLAVRRHRQLLSIDSAAEEGPSSIHSESW